MFLTSDYVLIVRVPVKSGFIYASDGSFLKKKTLTFFRLGWHVLRDFRLDVLRQRVL